MASPKPGPGAPFVSAAARDDLSADPHAAEHLMRWVGVAMFLLGSATLLATLPLPDPNTSDHPAIRVIALLLALGAVIVAVLRPGRRWISRVTILYGILLVSALMAVTRPIEATPFFYLWPLVFSAYFCTRREVVFDLALMWVTLGLAVFIWSHDPMKPGLFIGVGVSVTLTTLVVKLLAEHVSAVIRQLERAADSSGAPDPAALMLAADRALYAAKAAGRRRVAVWEGGATQIAAHIRERAERGESKLAAPAA